MAHVPHIKFAAQPQPNQWTFDWIGVWAICLGVGAVALALFVCFGGRDPGAASFILVAAAALIALFLREAAQQSHLD